MLKIGRSGLKASRLTVRRTKYTLQSLKSNQKPATTKNNTITGVESEAWYRAEVIAHCTSSRFRLFYYGSLRQDPWNKLSELETSLALRKKILSGLLPSWYVVRIMMTRLSRSTTRRRCWSWSVERRIKTSWLTSQLRNTSSVRIDGCETSIFGTRLHEAQSRQS